MLHKNPQFPSYFNGFVMGTLKIYLQLIIETNLGSEQTGVAALDDTLLEVKDCPTAPDIAQTTLLDQCMLFFFDRFTFSLFNLAGNLSTLFAILIPSICYYLAGTFNM